MPLLLEGLGAQGRIDWSRAALGADAGWHEAVAGCESVIHPASPTPRSRRAPMMTSSFPGGAMPGCPKVSSPYVDVRDVADLHLRAMTHPAAKSIADVARVLKRKRGAHVTTRELPNWLVRLAALRNPAAKALLPHLGAVREPSSAKAEKLRGWSPRPFEDAVVATADSLSKLGLVGPVA